MVDSKCVYLNQIWLWVFFFICYSQWPQFCRLLISTLASIQLKYLSKCITLTNTNNSVLMPANEDTHQCGLTSFFPIHFKLVDAYLCFSISSILIRSVCNNSPLLLTEPLSVMRGWSYLKKPKEHSSICVKTAEVHLYIFLIIYNNKYWRQEHLKTPEEIKTPKCHLCVCSQVEHL